MYVDEDEILHLYSNCAGVILLEVQTFLWRCLCCHFALLTFLLVYGFLSYDLVRYRPFSLSSCRSDKIYVDEDEILDLFSN